jgi:hypothetical protein
VLQHDVRSQIFANARLVVAYGSLAKYCTTWVGIWWEKCLEIAGRSWVFSPQMRAPSGSIFSKAVGSLYLSAPISQPTIKHAQQEVPSMCNRPGIENAGFLHGGPSPCVPGSTVLALIVEPFRHFCRPFWYL